MKQTHMNEKQMRHKTEDIHHRKQQSCGEQLRRKQKIDEVLELMRGIVRAPLGEFPERDERIKKAWHSSAE